MSKNFIKVAVSTSGGSDAVVYVNPDYVAWVEDLGEERCRLGMVDGEALNVVWPIKDTFKELGLKFK